MRPIALSRKNALFAGSDEGGENWAAVASLIETCLCRARHRQVYAARRTMPNGLIFPRNGGNLDVIGSA
jgi:transposase